MKPAAYILLVVLALTISVFSCKKDKSTPGDLLTAKSWKASSVTDNGVPKVIPECSVDDVIAFMANGTYSYNPGAIKCSTDDTNRTGTWSLSGDGKTLTMDGSSVLIDITESKLVMTMVIGTHTLVTTYIPAL